MNSRARRDGKVLHALRSDGSLCGVGRGGDINDPHYAQGPEGVTCQRCLLLMNQGKLSPSDWPALSIKHFRRVKK
jgi:hypothetical protein